MKNTTKYRINNKNKVMATVMTSWFVASIIFLPFSGGQDRNSEIVLAAPNDAEVVGVKEPTVIEEPIIEVVDNKIRTNLDNVNESILNIHKEKQAKKHAITIYLQRNNAPKELVDLVPMLVELCYINDIDPFRPISIIIHETGFGTSKAFKEKNNVAGLNWTSEQKRKIGIKSNIYNLAVEKTLEASVTNLVMLLVTYKNFKKPLITLTDIQTKYAPDNDARNGLHGMDNTTWRKHTIQHYKNINEIYLYKQ